jgi:hypothetical protein
MKINNILENMTPSSSTANQGGGQAPVMGRSDKFLETTSGASSSAVISPGGETTSKMQRRGKEGSNLLRGIKTSKKFVNSPMAESTVSEADISEEHLGAKERRKELFNKSKDRQLGNRPDSKDILPKDMEGEGDTLKNSLHTIIRVATHLDKALSVHDEFPEWISEKIGATKSMMVNIMNYVISNQEMQDERDNGEEINELSSEKLRQYKKAAGAQASELDKAAWAGAPDAKSKINKAKKQFANDIKKHYDGKTQGVAEATGDKPFDNMMKTIKKGTKKQATADRREQKAKNKEQAAAAFGNMFGGGNPADKLKIKEQGMAEGLHDDEDDGLIAGRYTPQQWAKMVATVKKKAQEQDAKKKMAVVKTDKPIGTRVSDIDPWSGKESNVRTDSEWDKQKGVAEGVETPQQQQVRAAITKGMEKWDQNDLATYQSQPTNRNYMPASGWASGQLDGINSIDPDGTVVIELDDTTTAGLVKKLASLGGMPGVKTRQLKMTFDPAKMKNGVIPGDVSEDQLDEVFEPTLDYYKLSNGKTVQASYRPSVNQSPVPFTDVSVSYVNPALKPQGPSFDSTGQAKPWTSAPDGVKQAIQKFVTQPQKGVAEAAPNPKHLQRYGHEADQTWPDDSNSLSKRYNDRDIVVPNLGAVYAGTAAPNKHYQSTPFRTNGMKIATKIKPSITKTSVKRKDSDRPVPSFLQKGVAEGEEYQQYKVEMIDRNGEMDGIYHKDNTHYNLENMLSDIKGYQRNNPQHTFKLYINGNPVNWKELVAKQGVAEESKGLWANIHAKQKRIKSGSGEHMRKPGSKGAPTAKSFKDSATKGVKETGAPAPTRMNPPREYDRRRGD